MSFDQFDRSSQDVGTEITVANREVLECGPLSDGESLRRTCIVLRAERNFFQVQHARAVEREEALKAVVAERDATIRDLKQRLFGRSRETTPGSEASPTGHRGVKKRKRGQQPGNPCPPRREHPGLEVREEVHALTGPDAACPQCGKEVAPFHRDEVSVVHEVEVRAYTRRIVKRCGRPTCSCGRLPGVVTPLVVGAVFPGSNMGVSAIVEMLLSKYFYGEPLNRVLQRWEALGFCVSPGTVHGLLKPIAALFKPVAALIAERNRQAHHWHIDETGWLVLAKVPGKHTHRWWMWVFVAADTVVFRISPHRSTAVIREHLGKQPEGIASVDRYASYKSMALSAVLFLLSFCWAHVRRDFLGLARKWPCCQDWALDWIERIGALYHSNNQRRDLHDDPAGAAYRAVDKTLRSQIAACERLSSQQRDDPTVHPAARKVLESLREHWTGLTLFVDRPWLDMDNNCAERALRPQVVGRKNSYFSGAKWSADLHADLTTVFSTLERNGFNVRTWLTDYLAQCAVLGGKPPPDISGFLPWNALSRERKRWTQPLPPAPSPLTPEHRYRGSG
jgi:transposase